MLRSRLARVVVVGALVLAAAAAAAAEEDMACVEPTVVLSNGVVMPRVGLGTAGRMGEDAVAVAVESGVRLFDTAQATEWYDEEAVARALKASGLRRDEYVVVTKLHPRDHGERRCAERIRESAQRFGGYIDVFLQHYPHCWGDLCSGEAPEGTFADSWRAMEAAYDAGTVRAVGVSNFGVADIARLLWGARVRPHVAQGWMDPFHSDSAVRQACRDEGITYMAYSTLGTQWAAAKTPNPVLTSETLKSFADDRGPAAVALSWGLQRGAVVIPRSITKPHIAANAALYDDRGRLRLCLDETALAAIDALDGTRDRSSSAQDDEAIESAVAVTFAATVDADIFWVDAETGEEVPVGAVLRDDDGALQVTSHPGHLFVARQKKSKGGALIDDGLRVTAPPGGKQTFQLDDRDAEL